MNLRIHPNIGAYELSNVQNCSHVDRLFASLDFSSPHIKAFLLLEAHLTRFQPSDFPISDYITDLKSVLDQAVRIIQAMIDTSAYYFSFFETTVRCVVLLQCVRSQCWWDAHSLLANGVLEEPTARHPQLSSLLSTLSDHLHDTLNTPRPSPTPRPPFSVDSLISKMLASISASALDRKIISNIPFHRFPILSVDVECFLNGKQIKRELPTTNSSSNVRTIGFSHANVLPTSGLVCRLTLTQKRLTVPGHQSKNSSPASLSKSQLDAWLIIVGGADGSVFALKRSGQRLHEHQVFDKLMGTKTSRLTMSIPLPQVVVTKQEVRVVMVVANDLFFGLDQSIDLVFSYNALSSSPAV